MSGKLLRFPQEKCSWHEFPPDETKILRWPRHKWYHCGDDCEGCLFCEGGIAACTRCGGGEASLPTDCPGSKMGFVIESAITCGMLDYRRRVGWICTTSGAPVTLEHVYEEWYEQEEEHVNEV